VCLVGIGVLVLATVFGWFWVAVPGRDRRSADEHLAEIEAARAIPDAENAAMIYEQLLQDHGTTAPMEGIPKSVDVEKIERVIREPWLGYDYPELAMWVKGCQPILDRLLEAMQFEKCRFPIIIDPLNTDPMNRAKSMSQWGCLLSIAANNDVAEGRIDAALSKWQCLIQMGNHLRQQPDSRDTLVALHIGELASEPVARFLIIGNPTEAHLQQVEAMPLAMKDHWPEYGERIRLTEALVWQRIMERAKERVSLSFCLRHPIQALRGVRSARYLETMKARSTIFQGIDPTHWIYRGGIATARGMRILVALRRYRNTNAHWPEGLDEIRASLSEEILTDPFSRAPFVYRPAADTLVLYSVGPNSSDQDGPWQSKAGDDWPIWPPIAWLERTPLLVWPEFALPRSESQ